MSLITKCSTCGTTFRVTSQQLQAHNGRVRCGNCMTVFDGLQALVTLPDAGADPQSKESAAAGAAAFVLEPVEPAAAQAVAARAAVTESKGEEKEYEPAAQQLMLDDELFRRPPSRGARRWAAGAGVAAV